MNLESQIIHINRHQETNKLFKARDMASSLQHYSTTYYIVTPTPIQTSFKWKSKLTDTGPNINGSAIDKRAAWRGIKHKSRLNSQCVKVRHVSITAA